MKGPGIFLAQFARGEPPFDTLEGMARWAAGLGYIGVQVPTSDRKLFDLERAADSKTYADELAGRLREAGVVITELSTHLQGQLVAVHPAYEPLFAAFAPPELKAKPSASQGWATGQLELAARASRNLGLDRAGRFRSLGDGRIDFRRIFSKLAQYGYAGSAVLEWECCLKHPEDDAREGAPFICAQMIRTTHKQFDDFAGGADRGVNRRVLGLPGES